jgi:hypothetical protein
MVKRKAKEVESKFIACPRYKNLPKKHVDVCRECKWNAKCKSFHAYLQLSLPLRFPR